MSHVLRTRTESTTASRGKKRSYLHYITSLVAHSRNNHSGNLQSGHYWANIKPHSSHEWLSCNDNRVAPINAESVNNATSYVLFFKKM